VAGYFWRQNRRLKKAGQQDVEPAKLEKTATATRPGAAEKLSAIERLSSLEKPVVTDKTNSPVREDRRAVVKPPVIPSTPNTHTSPSTYDSSGAYVSSGANVSSGAYVPSGPPADPLQEARQFFENADSKGFYREVNRAIWKAMNRKLELPASEQNKHNSLRQLQLRGWDDTALMTLENLLNECEMNLYTPAYDRWNMQQLLRQAEWVLDRLK
jgi:hypothetical protein